MQKVMDRGCVTCERFFPGSVAYYFPDSHTADDMDIFRHFVIVLGTFMFMTIRETRANLLTRGGIYDLKGDAKIAPSK